MSGPIISRPPDIQAYLDELHAYLLRLAEWLGLDPSQIFELEDVDRVQDDPSPIAMPSGVDVTWKTIDKLVAHEVHEGRHLMSVSASMVDGVTTFRQGLHLDWLATERLRAEVGDRPQFPAPAGGWPRHWPQP